MSVNAWFRQLSGTVAKAICAGPARTSPKFNLPVTFGCQSVGRLLEPKKELHPYVKESSRAPSQSSRASRTRGTPSQRSRQAPRSRKTRDGCASRAPSSRPPRTCNAPRCGSSQGTYRRSRPLKARAPALAGHGGASPPPYSILPFVASSVDHTLRKWHATQSNHRGLSAMAC